MNKLPVSYSRLSTFEQCEQKFDYLYVSKLVLDQGNVHSDYGDRVHKSLEAYGKTGDPETLTDETVQYRSLVDKLRARPGEKHWELQLAFTSDMTPCGWMDADVWLRGIVDVLIRDGTTAYCFDWKTGKVKDNPVQLQLFACLLFFQFPELNEVVARYVWLKHGAMTGATYTRPEAVSMLWPSLRQRFDVVQQTVNLGVYKAKPSGLCRWCPAQRICAYG